MTHELKIWPEWFYYVASCCICASGDSRAKNTPDAIPSSSLLMCFAIPCGSVCATVTASLGWHHSTRGR